MSTVKTSMDIEYLSKYTLYAIQVLIFMEFNLFFKINSKFEHRFALRSTYKYKNFTA